MERQAGFILSIIAIIISVIALMIATGGGEF